MTDWIEQAHREEPSANSCHNNDILPLQITSLLPTHYWPSNPTKSTETENVIGASTSTDLEDGEKGSSSSQDMRRHSVFPISVSLSSHVRYALTVLSAIIDHLDGPTASKSKGAESDLFPNKIKSKLKDNGKNTMAFTMHQLHSMTISDVKTEVVRSIASIPDLVKTVLLLPNESEKEFCLSSSIMQRVIASRYSIGPWLPGMLQSHNDRVLNLAIDYLKDISDKEVETSKVTERRWGESTRTLLGDTIDRDGKEANDLSDEVSRLDDFVPSLLSLGEGQLEEASTTRLVRKVLDRIVSRPFAVTIIFCDALFIVLLILGFRGAVSRLLLGRSTTSVLRHIYLANTSIFYFVIREIGKAVSLCMVSNRARIYFWSFWNWLDLLSTILALGSSVAIRAALEEEMTDVANIHHLRTLLAVTTGLLWLRVLNFLKGINMQLATFVFAILQVSTSKYGFLEAERLTIS